MIEPAALLPYVPRLLLEWQREGLRPRHRRFDATLVFTDLSGFTKMSERLSRKGKVGSEEVTDVINSSFARLLAVAFEEGGGLLKFGGDALLLLFHGPDHAVRACQAAARMQRRLRELGPLETTAGRIRLRMSIGMHTGEFDFFLAGDRHVELLVTGPAATQTVAMEKAANAGEILVSAGTAAAIDASLLGEERAGGFLLRRVPIALAPIPFPAPDPAPDPGMFLPAPIRDHVLAGVDEGEHRLATLAFLRFAETDRMILEEGPDAVGRKIDALVRRTQEAADDEGVTFLATDIAGNGGTIVMTAGAPLATANNEERMLRAMRAVFDAPCGLPLYGGINRGYIFAGTLGTSFRRTYATLGDAMNLAARLMQNAPAGRIVAMPEVIERSRTMYRTEPLPPFAAKGKAKPIQALVVGSAQGARESVGREYPLIGRDAEIAVLRDALSRAREGAGGLVDLVADAGLGKTRIVQELREHASGVTVLQTAGEQYESATPYFAVRRLLRAMLQLDRSVGGEEAGALLAGRVGALAPDLLPWLPLIAIPVGASVGATPEVDGLDTEFRSAKMRGVVGDLMSRAIDGPALLIVEDAQWLDGSSTEILRHVATLAPARPWLICVTRRPENTGYVPEEGTEAIRIAAVPLDRDAARALAHAVAGDVALSEHLVDEIARRSGGHPLFLIELVSAAVRGVEALPESIEAVMNERIDRLHPRDRTMLRFASVLGSEFTLPLLREIAGPAVGEADQQRWQRLEDFVVAAGEDRFRFRQGLLRDSFYEGLSFRRRRELHYLAGLAIERAHASEDDAGILSLHFHRAHEYEKAWRYARTAAKRARAGFSNIEAATFFRRALECARQIDVPVEETAEAWEGLGDVSELAGSYEEAAAAYSHARRGAPSASRARLMLKEGVIRERLGRYSDALRWYGRGIRAASEDSDGIADRIRLTLASAAARLRQGRYADCATLSLRAADDAQRIADKWSLARAYYLLDSAYTDLGHPDAARYRALALPIYEEIGDLVGQANVLNNLGVDAYYEGRWDDALHLYERSREARIRAGDVVYAAAATNNIAEILSDQGHLDQARPLFEEALRTWRAARYPVGVALATSNLGRLASRGGLCDEAAALLEEALDGFTAIKAEHFVLETQTRIAELRLAVGDLQAATRIATETYERAQRVGGMTPILAALLRVYALASLRAGDWPCADDALMQSLDLARSVNADYEAALTQMAIAALGRARGRPRHKEETESALALARLGVKAAGRVVVAPSVESCAHSPQAMLAGARNE